MPRFCVLAASLSILFLQACAGQAPLRPGSSTLDDLEQRLGAPAMRWPEPDGGERLAYPTGPMGLQTWMARSDAAGRLVSLENVLAPAQFARIAAGMSEDEVLRLLGPPYPGWTIYYKARDERVWEWRYCDDWAQTARFGVLFDGTSGKVRSTMSTPEYLSQPWGHGNRRDWCSR